METFAPPRGMRDFYPEDCRARDALFAAWRRAAGLWGFESFDAPVVETLELLERKSGEEIGEQIYAFKDKSGRGLALRPELTPSLARMIVARQGQLAFPLKWSAIAQCFRYERMTRGRKREHYQWNLDVVGEASLMAEAEVIGAAVESLRSLGLTSREFQVRVGSRALLMELFERSGLGRDHFTACCLALDKRGKISDEAVANLLAGEGMGAGEIERVFEMLAVQTLEQAAGRLGDRTPAVDELSQLFEMAADLNMADFLTFDLGVIRGLGYYTGIVFEAFDTDRELRAIFGGGRYDNLLHALGGQTMPSVGLGFGDVVVMELLAERDKKPASGPLIEYAVGYLDDASRASALRIAVALRAAGRGCDVALSAERARKFFSRADRIGTRQAIFLGPDEVSAGRFKIKPMAGGQPLEKSLDELVQSITPAPPGH